MDLGELSARTTVPQIFTYAVELHIANIGSLVQCMHG